MDIVPMPIVVFSIANPVVSKSSPPYLRIGSKFLISPVRKTTLDQLNRPLQRACRRDQQVKMIRHENKFVQQVRLTPVVQEVLEKQPGPCFCTKQSPALPSV